MLNYLRMIYFNHKFIAKVYYDFQSLFFLVKIDELIHDRAYFKTRKGEVFSAIKGVAGVFPDKPGCFD